MSAYNQYLEEIEKINGDIKQRQEEHRLAQRLALESFVKFKRFILKNEGLLVNFNGVINELKNQIRKEKFKKFFYNSNKFEELSSILESFFSGLEKLHENLIKTKGEIETTVAQKQLKDLIDFCHKKMNLSEIDNSLEKIKKIIECEKQEKLNIRFKKTGRILGGFIVTKGIALDPKTDLMWLMFSLDRENYFDLVYMVNEFNTSDSLNKIGIGWDYRDYIDWRLPTVEEFETLQKAVSLKIIQENEIKEYHHKKIIYDKKMTKVAMFSAAAALILSITAFMLWHSIFIVLTTIIVSGFVFMSIIGIGIKQPFEPHEEKMLPITMGDEYWTSSSGIDEEHGQICCRVENKIISRHVLKSEKYSITFVRKF